MTTPVLLVTGFLGAGKTTFVNALLAQPGGRRIAAIVNDFGSINIDEELIDTKAETVIGLANGCVCCTLQGDLLRTIKLLLTRDPAPDHIVIEASGIADPAGILQALQDPVLWRSARLDGVVCVVDALDYPTRRSDDLWKAQLAGANFIVLSKAGELKDEAAAELATSLSDSGTPPIIDLAREPFPVEVLLGNPLASAFRSTEAATPLGADRFAKVEWKTDKPISLAGLQTIITDFAPMLMRAKGLLSFKERPGRCFLLQLVVLRVTLEPWEHAATGCRLVLIGEKAKLDIDELSARFEALAH
jgi:G3E family GTPase